MQMIIKHKKQKGFSLLDIMVSIFIFIVLVVISTVSFNSWLTGVKVNTVIDGIDIGITQARAEAIKRNEFVNFQINEDTSWNIIIENSGDIINQKMASEENDNVKAITAPENSNMVTFDGYGVLVENTDGSPSINNIDAKFAVLNKEKVLRLQIEGTANTICNPLMENENDMMYCED